MATKTNYAILGILTLGPQSGYDIKKFIAHSIGHFWQESYGQLYPTLKNLVQQDMAEMQIKKNEGKPDKKVYTITEKGRTCLKTWLTEPVTTWPLIRNELLLKLFFGQEVDKHIAIDHIRNLKNKASAKKNELDAIYTMINNELKAYEGQRYWKITVLAGLHNYDAMIKWADESIEILKGEI